MENQDHEDQNHQDQNQEHQSQEEQEKKPNLVVGLSLCDSAPLLWRVQDLRTARSLGLVGALLGSLPRTPRQNVRLGRPLLLLPEEERLLSEERAVAVLPEQNQVSGPVGSEPSWGAAWTLRWLRKHFVCFSGHRGRSSRCWGGASAARGGAAEEPPGAECSRSGGQEVSAAPSDDVTLR